MINVVDDLLVGVLRKALGKAFAPAQMPEVVVGPPSSVPEDAPPTLSLHLYEVRENTALRQDPFSVRRDSNGRLATRSRSPLRFDLAYSVSSHAPDARAAHALLTFALGAFLREPVVEMPKPKDAEKAETIAIAIAQPEDSPGGLWPPDRRTAVALRVTAPFDPFDEEEVPLVRQAIFGYGPGTEPGFLGQPVDVRAVTLSAAGVVTAGGEALPNVLVSVPERLARTTTDENGRYLLLNLPPGRYEMVFERRGYVAVHQTHDVPPVGRVNELREFDVTMEPLDHDATLEAARNRPPQDFSHLLQTDLAQRTSVVGRLTYPDGSAAAFVPVRRGDQSTVTDSQGVYALSLAPSRHPLLAEIPGRGLVEVVDGTAPQAGDGPETEKPKPKAKASADRN